MILIIISVNIIKGTSSGFFAILVNFLSLSIGGMIIGVFFILFKMIFGIVATLWIKKIYFDSILITNITFVFSYLVYYTADHLVIYGNRFSGIISVLTFGIIYKI